MSLTTSESAPDFLRIRAEMRDLPFKEGYGNKFRVTVRKEDGNLTSPTLHISFRGEWYRYHLDLSGYPQRIAGHFVGVIPPCPIHGRKHPHVFEDRTFCWQLERNWRPSMTLAEDYIPFIFKTLENPQHHLGCGFL